jgi:molybdate transport system substrate-binding protein
VTGDTLLRLFMPGAFAQISTSFRDEYARVSPGTQLDFHEFIPSGLLAREIRAGAPADVYVSANTRYMDELDRDGFVLAPRVLAGNRLCVIVRPDAADRVQTFADLLEPSLRFVVPQPETDPCGQYIAKMFQEAGVEAQIRAKYEAGTLVNSRGSGDLPAFLFDGRVDVGIFYASEARSLGNAVKTIALPAHLDFHDRITFTVGRIADSDSRAAAEEFVDWLCGREGQELLQAFGFIPARLLKQAHEIDSPADDLSGE